MGAATAVLGGGARRIPIAALSDGIDKSIRSSPEEDTVTMTIDAGVDIRPFHIDIPQRELDDLRARLNAARLPTKEVVPDASQGVQLATLQSVARYWAT
jgi:hypothetical protein